MLSRLGRFSVRFLLILVFFGVLNSPGRAQPSGSHNYLSGTHPKPKEVSDEILALFGDGLSENEFFTLSGKVPRVRSGDINTDMVMVVLELENEPLAAVYAQEQSELGIMSVELQTEYLYSLRREQAELAMNLQSMSAEVIDQYTKSLNGLLVRLPANQFENVKSMRGVKALYPAPVHVPALEHSVPLIGAADVISDTGYDGYGIKIAMIDTGIDYTHKAFGGEGDPNEYAGNNPDIVEPDSFPTEKVIGGYDFAGREYDADDPEHNIPVPDEDPLDGDGHGTHVASIAAGLEVPGSVGQGVAPGAELYALKVFGEPAGSTNLTISAIEWAMDPNGDGDLSDHVDVINLSLESDFGPASEVDPLNIAVNNAAKIGIVVVAAAGNGGDTKYITGSPGSADMAISVAASTTGYITGPTVEVLGTTIVTNTNIIYEPSDFNAGGHFTQPMTAELFYAGDLAGASDDQLCTTVGMAEDELVGRLVLIQRGICTYTDQVNNAAELGALGAVVFNNEEGGNTRLVMMGEQVMIPAGFVTHADGLSLIKDAGEITTVSQEFDLTTIADRYSSADTMADFSSRGPRGYDTYLKPDISAPGVSIRAAEMGGGTTGNVYSGTSMASSHVAGVAALVRDAHPDWIPEQVKAAIMNTAVDLSDSASSELNRQGAGRVDAYRAVTTDLFAIGDVRNVSLNWGVVPIHNNSYVDRKTITIQNTSIFTQVYSVTWGLADHSYSSGFNISVPLTIEVKGSPGFAYVPVDLRLDGSELTSEFYTLEEYYGFVEFNNVADSQDVLRVPFYAVPQPYSELALTGSTLSGIGGSVELVHNGPITSSLVAYPLYVIDENEPMQDDEADIRYVGMDVIGDFGSGPIFSVAINVYGAWHTPQNIFAEFVLYLDIDQDDNWDYQVFNWNSGAATGSADNDEWVIIKKDLSSNVYTIGSNYSILTDYNTGYMEWWLPAYLYDLNSTMDTDFIYKLVGYDDSFFRDPNVDQTEENYFDIVRAPFFWSFSNNPGPTIPNSRFSFNIEDVGGYIDSHPLGMMIVDYRGEPGVGQAYAHTFSIEKTYIILVPLVQR